MHESQIKAKYFGGLETRKSKNPKGAEAVTFLTEAMA
jgi:hypothetical protein